MMHMMNDMCLCNAFKSSKIQICCRPKGTHFIIKKIIVQYIKASWAKVQKIKSIPKYAAHPLWSYVSVEVPLLMQQAGELQDLLFTGM